MGIQTVCHCDACEAEIDITNGDHPARLNVCAPTPASVGPQPEESLLCYSCWKALCKAFPRFQQAERFALPVPVSPPPVVTSIPLMDTWPVEAKEAFLAQLGQAMGVKVVQTPEANVKADDKK